jgi:hydrogenase nickel incorporation protein HypA/HybF
MHEFSLMKSLMTKISLLAAQNNARRVVSLTVRLGALSHMSPDHFQEHFEDVATGTVAENAKLHFEIDEDETSPTAQDILLESIEVES